MMQCYMHAVYHLILLTPFAYASEEKIIGGQKVRIVDYPYQVALELNGENLCSGTILGPNKVLTAAHCLNYNNYYVRAASDRMLKMGQLIKVKKKSIHPMYNNSTMDYDIGVLTLERHFQFNDMCKRAVLSKTKGDGNRTCMVSGWGYLGTDERPEILNAVAVEEMPHSECENLYKSQRTVTDRMICFGNPRILKDSCKGDSGGPLYDKEDDELVGVTSWGAKCNHLGGVGVYTSVAVLREWILHEMYTSRAQTNVVERLEESSASKTSILEHFFLFGLIIKTL